MIAEKERERIIGIINNEINGIQEFLLGNESLLTDDEFDMHNSVVGFCEDLKIKINTPIQPHQSKIVDGVDTRKGS